MNKKLLTLLIMGVFLGVGNLTSSAEDKAMMPADGTAMKSPMSPEEMARMKEYTTPNENHKVLESLAGAWKANVKMWMDPKATPEISEGSADSKIIMNGRFLEQNFTGTAMGQPFEGRGILGYDNIKKKFVSVWFDNMATGIMTGEGTYDAAKKTITSEGSMSCPISNEEHRWYKDVVTMVDNDHYTYESYMKDKEGKEYKGMEITYSRVK